MELVDVDIEISPTNPEEQAEQKVQEENFKVEQNAEEADEDTVVIEDIEVKEDNAEEIKDENQEKISKDNLENKSKNIRRELKKLSKKKNKVITFAKRTAITLLVTIVILLGGIYSVICMVAYGPSPTAKELFVISVKETSAIGFLANWFFTDDQVKEIMDKNLIKDTDEVTNTSLVVVNASDSTTTTKTEIPAIEVVNLKGSTYRGKLMIIKDPSTVFVGTIPSFCQGDGLVVSEIAKKYNAIGGINGGEFIDGSDITYTGMPVGLVMTKGNIVNGDKTTMCHVTGFTKDNILVVGNMTGQQALDLKMRDCVSISNRIGPFLIINGEAQEVGGGINPRTAIGQRADGVVLLVVTDGRQANTLGATFEDLVFIMQQYGAVNASAMDGGTSTQMYYQGEVVNTPYSPTGPRRCPTSFLVGGSK